MKKGCLFFVLIPVIILAVVVLFFFFQNQAWFTQTAQEPALSPLEKAHLQEALHLRAELGNELWVGWGNADLPMIAFNERYAFLTGMENPADGWYKVPVMNHYGTKWEVVPGDDFGGAAYYRQALKDRNPEAFAVLIGEQWVSSLTTKDWFRLSFTMQMRDELPAPVDAVFPYRIFVNQLLSSSDHYIAGTLHESFHAFQGTTNADRLNAAEAAAQQEENYPWDDAAEAWTEELNVLSGGMDCADTQTCAAAARAFLALRAERRAAMDAAADWASFEREREWLEGLAKYTEIKIWQLAGESETYQPLAALDEDDDFDRYQKHQSYWNRERDQVARMDKQASDTRFYYSGMVQAVWLDQLMPDWKTRIFEDGVYLEDLLAEAAGESDN
ncbi:MAG: hypothetical protein JW750_07100 [Anaerolineaceae bacterium]|nr:hypothetical protein [Anaerolineaceae bacterium]